MAQKVVHVKPKVHEAAKAYCKEHGLKMSDWVSKLILDATGTYEETDAKRVAVPRGKKLEPLDVVDPYDVANTPPFWAPPPPPEPEEQDTQPESE